MEAALDGGFADAPRDAAHAFRAAMSVAAGTLILTLCDPETPVHLAGGHDTPDVRGWIAFHTGAPVVARAAAAFAVGTWDALLPLDSYRIGEAEYPDRSATLIVELTDLRPEGATLTGPGIRDTARLSLPETEAFRRNARLFPLGLDFFLTAGDRVAALPRTTRVG
jgi:alpha-D-ribose 1-methylphosphonate 5-triphosphate synthase subunit PhnH